MKMRNVLFFKIAIVGLIIFLIGCATVKISEIRDDPQKYKDVNVNIQGKVENSIKLADYNIIKLVDKHENSLIVVKYKYFPEVGKSTVLNGNVKVYHIPIIDKNIFYIIDERASSELKKLKNEKSKEFKQFMKELKRDIKELSNDKTN